MRYGMSEHLGNQVFGRPMMGQYLDSTLSFGENCNFSERTAERIDAEVAELMDRTYRRVKGIVSQQRNTLERITAELQKRETIGREDLRRIMAEVEAERKPAVA
jgi:ATP-dependent Zn protease